MTYNEKLKAWVIPQLTQYDKFTFKAAVKNTDDTAVYEWTRGMGANRTVIDGATTNEVSVDTSSTNVFTYIIDGKVTCKGQTISLPRIRVSKSMRWNCQSRRSFNSQLEEMSLLARKAPYLWLLKSE